MRLEKYLELKNLSPAQMGQMVGLSRSGVEKHLLDPAHKRFRMPRKKHLDAYARVTEGQVRAHDFLNSADSRIVTAPAGGAGPASGLQPRRSAGADNSKAGRSSRASVDGDGARGLPTRSAIAVKPLGKKRAPIAMAIRIARAKKGAATRARLKRSRA